VATTCCAGCLLQGDSSCMLGYNSPQLYCQCCWYACQSSEDISAPIGRYPWVLTYACLLLPVPPPPPLLVLSLPTVGAQLCGAHDGRPGLHPQAGA
jgi:hypothetical protein